MKSKDKTKQKKHESTIGKIIYGFLLFMPLLAIGVTCAYAIFNKNAYQSYYGETINEEQIVHVDYQDLEIGEYYIYDTTTYTQYTGIRRYIYVENFKVTNGTTYNNIDTIDVSSGYIVLRIGGANGTYVKEYNLNNNTKPIFEFNYLGSDVLDTPYKDFFYQREYNSYSFVSEVFYYSIDKVQQSPLFNWAEDSAIYTGMTATCNALNITTTFIPLLMTYWLIISIIYFLYDIILIILHVFHRKIHELEESI